MTKDDSIQDQINKILGIPEVDCAVDCVGYSLSSSSAPLPLPFLSPYLSFHPNLLYNRFEARGCGHDGHKKEMPAQVLNASMAITKAGGKIGIPGLYVTEDPGIIFCSILIFSLSFLC